MSKKEFRSLSHIIHKDSFKSIIDLNVKVTILNFCPMCITCLAFFEFGIYLPLNSPRSINFLSVLQTHQVPCEFQSLRCSPEASCPNHSNYNCSSLPILPNPFASSTFFFFPQHSSLSNTHYNPIFIVFIVYCLSPQVFHKLHEGWNFVLAFQDLTHGDSEARCQIRAVAAGLHHSHRNARSKPRLQPTPQLTATPDP